MPRPWVGRLWAKSRIDDLLDEIALNGANQELSDEVTELALAYNFVTPYTSFLAIPASEVDAVSANELASARARKQEVMKRKSGAASLAGAEPGQASAPRVAAPSPAPDNAVPLSSTADRSSEGEDTLKEITKAYRVESDRKGGCASCNFGGRPVGDDVMAMASLLALLGLLRLRRRKN